MMISHLSDKSVAKAGHPAASLFLFTVLPISFGAEARHCQVKDVGVGAGIVAADVGVRQVLIAIADREGLALLAKDLQPASEVDGVHPLRALRRENAVDEIDEPAVGRQERLYAALGVEGCAETHRAEAAAIG